jgi:four helix bundle protein
MNPTPNETSLSHSSRFDALEVALELIRALRPVIAKIRRHSREDADQIHRASTSIARNLGEGSRRLGRDRVQYWSVAAGSAQEVKDALRTCLAAGFIDAADLREVWPLVDRECAMTWKMTH